MQCGLTVMSLCVCVCVCVCLFIAGVVVRIRAFVVTPFVYPRTISHYCGIYSAGIDVIIRPNEWIGCSGTRAWPASCCFRKGCHTNTHAGVLVAEIGGGAGCARVRDRAVRVPLALQRHANCSSTVTVVVGRKSVVSAPREVGDASANLVCFGRR